MIIVVRGPNEREQRHKKSETALPAWGKAVSLFYAGRPEPHVGMFETAAGSGRSSEGGGTSPLPGGGGEVV